MKYRRWIGVSAVTLLIAGGSAAAAAVSAQADPSPIFSATCPASAPTSLDGCGGVSDGTSTAPEPGFLPDEPANPNDVSTQQNAWSNGHGAQQMTVYSYHDWQVTATDGPSPTAEILTYPDTSFNYYDAASPARYNIRDLNSVTSSYSETMPPLADNYTAEAAYDVWLNNWATEVMVWTDVHYQGVNCNGAWTPECSGGTRLGTWMFGTQQWSLWDNGNGVSGFYMWLPDDGPRDSVSEPSGKIDLLGMLRQTAVSGGFSPSSTLTAIQFGWEIASTNGVPLNFRMNDIEVSVNGSPGPSPSPSPTATPPPPSPLPKMPAPKVVSVGSNRYLLWQPVKGAQAYQVQVLSGAGKVLHGGTTTGTWVSSYLTAGSYKEITRAGANGLWAAWSPATAFR